MEEVVIIIGTYPKLLDMATEHRLLEMVEVFLQIEVI